MANLPEKKVTITVNQTAVTWAIMGMESRLVTLHTEFSSAVGEERGRIASLVRYYEESIVALRDALAVANAERLEAIEAKS